MKENTCLPLNQHASLVYVDERSDLCKGRHKSASIAQTIFRSARQIDLQATKSANLWQVNQQRWLACVSLRPRNDRCPENNCCAAHEACAKLPVTSPLVKCLCCHADALVSSRVIFIRRTWLHVRFSLVAPDRHLKPRFQGWGSVKRNPNAKTCRCTTSACGQKVSHLMATV